MKKHFLDFVSSKNCELSDQRINPVYIVSIFSTPFSLFVHKGLNYCIFIFKCIWGNFFSFLIQNRVVRALKINPCFCCLNAKDYISTPELALRTNCKEVVKIGQKVEFWVLFFSLPLRTSHYSKKTNNKNPIFGAAVKRLLICKNTSSF